MADFVDYYELLGCAPDSTLVEIKQAYHEKLREYHPDKRPNSQEGRGKKVTATLNEAWEILKDDARREHYDRLWLKARPPAFAVPRPPCTADECRRAGNDLYRAANAVAARHEADPEGITFGAEGMGWAKQVLEKYQAAIDLYSKGLDFSPDDHRLLNNRALCYAALKMWSKCQEDARKVTEVKPDFKKGWFLLAKALWKEGQLARAKEELESALKVLPDCADLHELLIEVQHSLNEQSGRGQLAAIAMRRQSMSRSVSPVATPPSCQRLQPPPNLHRPMPPRRAAETPPSPPDVPSGPSTSKSEITQASWGSTWLNQSHSLHSLHDRQALAALAKSSTLKSSVSSMSKNWRFPRSGAWSEGLGALEGTARFGETTTDFGERVKYLNRSGSVVSFSGLKDGKTLWDMAQRAARNRR